MSKITKADIRKRLGNITQLQDLLFGDQLEEYNHKLQQYSQKIDHLETNYKKFQLVIEEQISHLENKTIHRINSVANSLERKIKYLSLASQKEHHKLRQELSAVSQDNQEHLDFLQNSLNSNTNSLKTEIIQTKSALDRDMQLLKQQITEKLESNLLDLSTNKISREDLAEVLFELCLKLKETNVDSELAGNQENQEFSQNNKPHSDLILSETKNESKL